jgi:uncharacterized damage-inducible protein DinB
MKDELQRFIEEWERETQVTLALLRSLPRDKYDFRPDPESRSLGELGWHLAEVEGYMTHGIEAGRLDIGAKVPGLERPKTVDALAPGFERIHDDAAARVRKLTPDDLSRTIEFFDGRNVAIRDVLWRPLLFHGVHHRGQLALMTRLAGGSVPRIYGPNREESAALRAARA